MPQEGAERNGRFRPAPSAADTHASDNHAFGRHNSRRLADIVRFFLGHGDRLSIVEQAEAGDRAQTEPTVRLHRGAVRKISRTVYHDDPGRQQCRAGRLLAPDERADPGRTACRRHLARRRRIVPDRDARIDGHYPFRGGVRAESRRPAQSELLLSELRAAGLLFLSAFLPGRQADDARVGRYPQNGRTAAAARPVDQHVRPRGPGASARRGRRGQRADAEREGYPAVPERARLFGPARARLHGSSRRYRGRRTGLRGSSSTRSSPACRSTATTSTTSSDTSTPRACSAIRARSERFSTRSTTCPRACRLRSC